MNLYLIMYSLIFDIFYVSRLPLPCPMFELESLSKDDATPLVEHMCLGSGSFLAMCPTTLLCPMAMATVTLRVSSGVPLL